VSVALVIQHAKRMRSIILSSLACMVVKYFSTLSHKRRNIRKKILNIKFVFCISLKVLPEIRVFLILRRIQWGFIINVQMSPCQYPFSCQILIKLEFCRQGFEEILKYKIS
jgi:hypothetical protein